MFLQTAVPTLLNAGSSVIQKPRRSAGTDVVFCAWSHAWRTHGTASRRPVSLFGESPQEHRRAAEPFIHRLPPLLLAAQWCRSASCDVMWVMALGHHTPSSISICCDSAGWKPGKSFSSRSSGWRQPGFRRARSCRKSASTGGRYIASWQEKSRFIAVFRDSSRHRPCFSRHF